MTRFEGKAKLSQNHPVGRRQRVIDRLAAGDAQDRGIAAAMARVLAGGAPWPVDGVSL